MNLLDPRLWLAFVLWTAAVSGYSYYRGDIGGRNSVMVESLTKTNQALNKRISDNEVEKKQQSDKAKKASEDHAKELKAVRDTAKRDAGKRVPISADFCRSAGTTESTTPGSDGQADTGASFLPEPFTGDLRQLTSYADEVSADLRTLKRRADEAGCFQ